MPNFYVRKHPERVVNEDNLKKGLQDIQNKIETPSSAARKYSVKRTTVLSRIAKGASKESKFQSKFSSTQVLTAAQERELADYFKKCSNLHHGLTYELAKELVYQYVTINNIQYPSSWDNEKKAGKMWLWGFMRRNADISLRKPENTSINRLRAFNENAVGIFFENLKQVYTKMNYSPERIYNLDETGITTVLDSPKVIAEKGKRTVAQAASAERGILVTVVGIVNAAGNHVPPVYVFPRKRMNPGFLKGAVSGSIALLSDNGWMNRDIFPEVLMHLKTHVRCSKEDPILLLLDNHDSHCNLAAVTFCKENGIEMLTFPPHTSHKLQPLDVSVYGPFKNFCKVSFNSFTVNNPGKPIAIHDVAELTKSPFIRAFSPENILKGFNSTGIFPYNEFVFNDSDFCDENESETIISQEEQTVIEEVQSKDQMAVEACAPPETPVQPSTSTFNLHNYVSPDVIRPLPKIPAKKSKRNIGRSRIYTNTPEKKRLEELEAGRKKNIKKTKPEKKIKQKPNRKHVRQVLNSSSEDISGTFSVRDSDKSVNFSTEESFDEEINVSNTADAGLNDYVLVKFGEKKIFYYVGLIVGVELDNPLPYLIKYLRRQRKTNCFYEPDVEDLNHALASDLAAKLPRPENIPGTSRCKNKVVFKLNFSKIDVR